MKPQLEDVEDDYAAEEENKLINEEYKIWKKNAPYLYDLVITHALDWPSLTCQWFPDSEPPAPGKNHTTHRVLLGTHTSGQAQDYLQIAKVLIPNRDTSSAHPSDKLDLGRENYDSERGELGGHTIPPSPRIQITQKIIHPGEVNRARYMPQNPDLLGTKAVSGEVLVFDRTKHGDEPDKDGIAKPDIRLVGQSREGYGLAWNPLKMGHVLGASEDMTVCHWDIQSNYAKKSPQSQGSPTIEPTNVFKGHTSVVGDVDWHSKKDYLFASVGDDKMLLLWDTRTPTSPVAQVQAHDREILAVAFSPASEDLLVTGSADKTSILHDLRSLTSNNNTSSPKTSKKLHTFESHTDEVLHLSWSPHNPTIFASASSDRRVNIWDLSLIGVEQSPDDGEDGPPELVFVHGGHTSRPTDFCWSPSQNSPADTWTALSASEDNVVMVWQPTMRVWAGEGVKVDVGELEEDAMEGVEGPSNLGNQRGEGSGNGLGNGDDGDDN